MPVSPARQAAFQILLRVDQQNAYASELLHSEHLAPLSPADRGLCTELVMGCLRWRQRLDHLIGDTASQPLGKLDPEVLAALRLGAYQLRFLTRVPPNAAVNESVELVKRARKKSAASFVNAVLHKLARQADDSQRAKGGVPSHGEAGSVVSAGTEAVFTPADAAAGNSPSALAAAWSHPEWLVARWVEQFGSERTSLICQFDQQTPTTTLRFPSNPEQAEALERELQAEGVTLGPGRLLRSARVVRAGDVTHTRVWREGRIAIQDEGSQLVAALVGTDPRAGLRILDCCAAPGGKTAAIAESNPQATILAVELHPHRADLLRRRLAGSSGGGIEVLAADATRLPHGRDFDRILADVPCSGTGTLARHPEIKWKLRPEDLPGLRQAQTAILAAALGHLAPGGVLVYSTCSLEPEENASVVEEALRGNPLARLLDCAAQLGALKAAGELTWPDIESLCAGPYLQTLPGVHPCDGFFATMIRL